MSSAPPAAAGCLVPPRTPGTLSGSCISRFAVRPCHRIGRRPYLRSPRDGLGAINREAAGLSRLSPGQDGRRHHGHSLDGDLAGELRPWGQCVTASVFLRPASKHGACSPRSAAHPAGPAGGDTMNSKPSRTLEQPQRRADAVCLHRDRPDQARKHAGHKWHDNDLMSASQPAPRSSPGIRTDARSPAIRSSATRSSTSAGSAAAPGKPGARAAGDPRNRRHHSTSGDDRRARPAADTNSRVRQPPGQGFPDPARGITSPAGSPAVTVGNARLGTIAAWPMTKISLLVSGI